MKKSLVLSLALATSVAAMSTAFAAANPFADVPSKHWAYDAVSQLAKDGVVDGYSDKTFQGDKTMTRYEMAQVVGKAVARADKASAADKKLIDKLSTEFAAELNNLGVRVANLEKNASNLKFTGDVRLRYDNLSGTTYDKGTAWKDRYRLNMTSQINDKVTFNARYVFDDDKFNQETKGRLSDLNLSSKVGATTVTAGRYSLNMGPTTYFSGTTGDVEGIMTNSKVGNFGLMLGYAQARNTGTASLISNMTIKNFDFAEATYTAGKAKIYADYFKNLNSGTFGVADAYDIFGGALAYKFDKNWAVTGEYYKNSADDAKLANGDAPKATLARLQYKGASAANPGTFGLFFEYGKMEGDALPYKFTGAFAKLNYADINGASDNGIKFYNVEFDYGVAKNVTFNAMYQFGIKDAVTGNDVKSKNFTRAQFNYLF